MFRDRVSRAPTARIIRCRTKKAAVSAETAALTFSPWTALYSIHMWLIALVGLIFPRIAAVILYFFTTWFTGVFATVLWPILGFIFAPYTMLWYSAVINWYGGE